MYEVPVGLLGVGREGEVRSESDEETREESRDSWEDA